MDPFFKCEPYFLGFGVKKKREKSFFQSLYLQDLGNMRVLIRYWKSDEEPLKTHRKAPFGPRLDFLTVYFLSGRSYPSSPMTRFMWIQKFLISLLLRTMDSLFIGRQCHLVAGGGAWGWSLTLLWELLTLSNSQEADFSVLYQAGKFTPRTAEFQKEKRWDAIFKLLKAYADLL